MAFALFETPLGPVAVAWSPSGITRLAFARTPAALRQRFSAGGEPEARRLLPFVRRTVESLRRHLGGHSSDFAGVPLDFPAGARGLVDIARTLREVPPGETVALPALALKASTPGGEAGVRRLLQRNPFPILVPGHRVLGTEGALGAWGGGAVQQERLLRLEGLAHLPLHDGEGRPTPRRVEAALGQLRAADPELGGLMERVGPFGLQLRRGHSPYEALARSIVGQQISGRAATAILSRLAKQFGTPGVPPPARIRAAKDAELRAAGLSAGKAKAFRDLAARTLAGAVPSWRVLRRWPDERILSTLTEIHGVGVWTVEMVLLFRLGRPDVLPLGDYGIRKGFGRTFLGGRLPSARQLERRGWRWRPFRSVASWYLWRALELP
jgi:3-methyladenine DNA glycosylase/8-oxoguanine DNA glycosylase